MIYFEVDHLDGLDRGLFDVCSILAQVHGYTRRRLGAHRVHDLRTTIILRSTMKVLDWMSSPAPVGSL